MENLSIYKKLFLAREYIITCGEEKKGWNDYSKYKYYTPEQINQLVFQACKDQNIIPLFSLKRNELGIFGVLKIQDLDSNGFIEFEMASAIPEIKATNASQQLGGAVTYTERYLLMTAFEIKDNSLDPDSLPPDTGKPKSPQPKDTPPTSDIETHKKWLNKWKDKEKTIIDPLYEKVVAKTKANSKTIADIRLGYKVSKEIEKELEKDLK